MWESPAARARRVWMTSLSCSCHAKVTSMPCPTATAPPKPAEQAGTIRGNIMKSNLSTRVCGRVLAHALLTGCALTTLTIASAHARPNAATPAGAPRAAGSITGTVSQVGSGEYLDGASVSIPALDLSTVVDRTGRFTLLGVPVGTHEIVIRYVGYPDARRTVTVADAAVTLDVAMTTVVGATAG
ncbi:MAG: carboxypeptidase-like regulatory domain-containing protein, partial [Sphingomonas sp.]